MPARTLMIQGTASHAGKTVIAAALGRLFWRAGWRVAPFKAQNLSLNAVVAAGAQEGEAPGEIGWAQALQARACGVEPTLDMNPVLLKPEPSGCQLIVRGRVAGRLPADGAGAFAPAVVATAGEALARLRAAYDLVILEGAGSPAEINLHERDLANRWAAEAADAPILLVGDISRGGVFAALLGTWMLSPHPQRIAGFIINKLHGGAASLAPGLEELERRTGVPTLGVIPWRDPELPEEDSLGLPAARRRREANAMQVGVVRLPHIANFTDFDTLARMPGVEVFYSWDAAELAAAEVLILPGTKSTVADLEALRERKLDAVIQTAAARGVPVLGICGGYQMLGEEIVDREGVESARARTQGLGLLPVWTEFAAAKRTERLGGSGFGYCIHHGRIHRRGGEALHALADGSAEGCRQARIAGTVMHGGVPETLIAQWLEWSGRETTASPWDGVADLDMRLERWAEHVRAHVAWERIVARVETGAK